VIGHIKAKGWDKSNIGIEAGHSVRTNQGFLTSTEHQLIREGLPGAKLVSALAVIDKAAFIKDATEIALMRQAAAMADSAIATVKGQIEVGMSETMVAGIGEMELRRLGSEYHWSVTGGTEPFAEPHPPARRSFRNARMSLSISTPAIVAICRISATTFFLGR